MHLVQPMRQDKFVNMGRKIHIGNKVILFKIKKIGLVATLLGDKPMKGVSVSDVQKFRIGGSIVGSSKYKFIKDSKPNRKKFRKITDNLNEFLRYE